MTVAETIIKKVLDLPLEKQTRVLDMLLALENKSQGQFRDPEGLLADTPTNLSFEDFKKTRQEMWGRSSKKDLG